LTIFGHVFQHTVLEQQVLALDRRETVLRTGRRKIVHLQVHIIILAQRGVQHVKIGYRKAIESQFMLETRILLGLHAQMPGSTKDGPLGRRQGRCGQSPRRGRSGILVASGNGGFPDDATAFTDKGTDGMTIETNVLPHDGCDVALAAHGGCFVANDTT
jgi:hypothetical protein